MWEFNGTSKITSTLDFDRYITEVYNNYSLLLDMTWYVRKTRTRTSLDTIITFNSDRMRIYCFYVFLLQVVNVLVVVFLSHFFLLLKIKERLHRDDDDEVKEKLYSFLFSPPHRNNTKIYILYENNTQNSILNLKCCCYFVTRKERE